MSLPSPSTARNGRDTPRIRFGLAPTALAVAALSLAVLALHARRYMPFVADDALISLGYAQRLLQGHGLTWSSGERVEGYSNLAWVLASAFLGRLGVDLVLGLRILGFVGMAATFAAILYAHRAASVRAALPALLRTLALALSGPVAVWTIGGMETPFVAAFLAWALVLSYPLVEANARPRDALPAGLFFALLGLTRPDGVLFAVVAAAVIGLRARGFSAIARRAAGVMLLPALFGAGQLAFRVLYYHAWVPNTALVKLRPSLPHLVKGLGYLGHGLLPQAPLLVLVGAGVWLCIRRRFRLGRLALLIAGCGAWLAYVACIGGDNLPAMRHLVPLDVLMALVLAQGVECALQDGRRWERGATLAAVPLLGLFGLLELGDLQNRHVLLERFIWVDRCHVIGTLLKQAFSARQPLLAVDSAGCLPYWSELPCIDMLGLNDAYIARHPAGAPEHMPVGHEMANGAYVLDRAPDLVILNSPTGNARARFLSGAQMLRDPRFRAEYSLTTFEARDPDTLRAVIWVRRDSPKIGIQRSATRVVVPAYLLNADPNACAFLDAQGRFAVRVGVRRRASIVGLETEAGRWRIDVDAGEAPVRVGVRAEDPAIAAMEQRPPVELTLPRPTRLVIDVMLETKAESDVRAVVLTRVPEP